MQVHDVLQFAPLGGVIQHIVDGEERHAKFAREALQFAQAFFVVAVMEHGGRQPDAAGRELHQTVEAKARLFAHMLRRHDCEQESFLPFRKIVEAEGAFAFFGAPLAVREETAEPAIGRAVRWIGEDVGRAVPEHEPRTHQKLRLFAFQRLDRVIGAHDSGHAVAVGGADGIEPKFRRRKHKFVRMRRAPQEREIGRHGKFGIGTHAKSPCTNQCGVSVSRP